MNPVASENDIASHFGAIGIIKVRTKEPYESVFMHTISLWSEFLMCDWREGYAKVNKLLLQLTLTND